MSTTNIGINSPQAVKRWATSLAVLCDYYSYFTRFIGRGENSVIERKVGLEDDAGDEIRFDLSMPLRGSPVYGDNIVEGTEESLTFYQDQVRIDQVRKGASAGGRMTRKRSLQDLRKIARDRTAEYMGRWTDELLFTYLSGDSAIAAVNQDNTFTTAFANNAITAPDADHIAYGGSATSKATVTASDKMSVALVERLAVKAAMMNATNPDVADINPITIEAAEHYVLCMSPWQSYQLRTETGDISWSKIAQAAATSEGRKSPIFKGGLGMINNIVLHEHKGIRRFSDYGAGSNVPAARALFLGRQAGVVAYGSGGNGTRMNWVEKLTDADNLVSIFCGAIMGAKKTTFNNRDFGVIAVDTAAAAPS